MKILCIILSLSTKFPVNCRKQNTDIKINKCIEFILRHDKISQLEQKNGPKSFFSPEKFEKMKMQGFDSQTKIQYQ